MFDGVFHQRQQDHRWDWMVSERLWDIYTEVEPFSHANSLDIQVRAHQIGLLLQRRVGLPQLRQRYLQVARHAFEHQPTTDAVLLVQPPDVRQRIEEEVRLYSCLQHLQLCLDHVSFCERLITLSLSRIRQLRHLATMQLERHRQQAREQRVAWPQIAQRPDKSER